MSRFDRFPIQMNFAENQNGATNPILAAHPAQMVGGLMKGEAATDESGPLRPVYVEQSACSSVPSPPGTTEPFKYHILQTSNYVAFCTGLQAPVSLAIGHSWCRPSRNRLLRPYGVLGLLGGGEVFRSSTLLDGLCGMLGL